MSVNTINKSMTVADAVKVNPELMDVLAKDGIDFSRGNGFDQKDSNYIIIRYLDSGFFLEKDGTAPTEWQKNAAETTAKFNYDVNQLI